MSLQGRSRSVGVLVLVTISGCLAPVDTAWSISFENPADDAEADFVFADVRREVGISDCPTHEDYTVRGPYQIRPPTSPEDIDTLETDTYCFMARAVRDDCTLVAEGFVSADLPVSRDAIEIVLRTAGGGACEPGFTCTRGLCLEDDLFPPCLAGLAYCPTGDLCCPGADEISACFTHATAPSSCREPE